MMKQYDEAMERPHENLAVVPAMVAEPEQEYGADVFVKKMEVKLTTLEVETESKKVSKRR